MFLEQWFLCHDENEADDVEYHFSGVDIWHCFLQWVSVVLKVVFWIWVAICIRFEKESG